MKYYIYISDAKVDMLFPQIPHEAKKKVAKELKIDFKIFGASRKTEIEVEENRITRLEAVVAYLSEFGEVGSVDEPGKYINGTMPLTWGPVKVKDSRHTPFVYFSGETRRTVVGLGGSKKHMIGNNKPPADDLFINCSERPGMEEYMSEAIDKPIPSFPFDAPTRVEALSWVGTPAWVSAPDQLSEESFEDETVDLEEISAKSSLNLIYDFTQGMRGPRERMEFFAKTLLYEPSPRPADSRNILLVTPLYVALAD